MFYVTKYTRICGVFWQPCPQVSRHFEHGEALGGGCHFNLDMDIRQEMQRNPMILILRTQDSSLIDSDMTGTRLKRSFLVLCQFDLSLLIPSFQTSDLTDEAASFWT